MNQIPQPQPLERPGVRALRNAPPMNPQMQRMQNWVAQQRPQDAMRGGPQTGPGGAPMLPQAIEGQYGSAGLPGAPGQPGDMGLMPGPNAPVRLDEDRPLQQLPGARPSPRPAGKPSPEWYAQLQRLFGQVGPTNPLAGMGGGGGP